MKEKLSAFIDAELTEQEERRVLNELAGNRELRSTWERYHLMRAIFTKQLDVTAPPGLADRIFAQINEAERAWRPRTIGVPRIAGGLAIAATVAALAIFGLQTLNQPDTSVDARVASTRPTTAAIAANSVGAETEVQAEGRFNAYLVGHNEFMPTTGMGGMLPYVRVVIHDHDK